MNTFCEWLRRLYPSLIVVAPDGETGARVLDFHLGARMTQETFERRLTHCLVTERPIRSDRARCVCDRAE